MFDIESEAIGFFIMWLFFMWLFFMCFLAIWPLAIPELDIFPDDIDPDDIDPDDMGAMVLPLDIEPDVLWATTAPANATDVAAHMSAKRRNLIEVFFMEVLLSPPRGIAGYMA